MVSNFGFEYNSIRPFVWDREIKNRKTLPRRTWLYPWLVSGRVVAKNGFCLFKEAKSENMVHRKIVALEILYRIICSKIFFSIIVIMKTRLKVVEVQKKAVCIKIFTTKWYDRILLSSSFNMRQIEERILYRFMYKKFCFAFTLCPQLVTD